MATPMLHRKPRSQNPSTPLTLTPSLILIPLRGRVTNYRSRIPHTLGLQLSLSTIIQIILRIHTMIARIRRHIRGRSSLAALRLPVAAPHDTKIISIFSTRESFGAAFGHHTFHLWRCRVLPTTIGYLGCLLCSM